MELEVVILLLARARDLDLDLLPAAPKPHLDPFQAWLEVEGPGSPTMLGPPDPQVAAAAAPVSSSLPGHLHLVHAPAQLFLSIGSGQS